jgi:hypothetical protein
MAEGEVRSLDQFMDDQVKYEQKKYEKLKMAIMREESEDIHLFQPQITQKSIDILSQQSSPSSKNFYIQKRKQHYINQKLRDEHVTH